MEWNSSDAVPEHQGGVATDTESSEVFANDEDAAKFYQVAKERLMNPHRWKSLAGFASADFFLTDDRGRQVDRSVQQGDHLKIDIPGPGSVTGAGYDWVQVEMIDAEDRPEKQFTTVTVRPAPNPLNREEDVAHFFDSGATSSFHIRREGNRVTAAVYGRNEKPNTGSDKAVDVARNTAIATGAFAGFSKIQWKLLTNGIVKRD